jgi:hypothetical protein
MTINPKDLPDELVKKATAAAKGTLGSVAARAAIAAFLNGAVETGRAKEADLDEGYGPAAGNWTAATFAVIYDRCLILRLQEGGK